MFLFSRLPYLQYTRSKKSSNAIVTAQWQIAQTCTIDQQTVGYISGKMHANQSHLANLGRFSFFAKIPSISINTSSTVNRNSRTVHVCRMHVLNVRSKDKRSFMHTPLSRFVTVLQFLLIDNKTETKSNLCYANLLAVDPATQTPWKFLKVSQCWLSRDEPIVKWK